MHPKVNKRICCFIPSLRSGGAERVLTELVNYLSSKGYDVTFVTLDNPKYSPFYTVNNTVNLVQLDLIQEEGTCFRRALHLLKRIQTLRCFIKNLQPDVIISFIDIMNILTMLATVFLKIRVIVCERTNPRYHKIPKFYQWLRTLTYPFAAKVVVQTQSAANFFSPFIQKKMMIVPNVVRKPAEVIQTVSAKVQHIISVGRLSFEKDHQTLIRAFALLIKDMPHLTLTIYGEGPERKKLERVIHDLGLGHVVSLPGDIYHIEEKLLKSDLFVFSSIFEGFPNALCEAMAVGLPVIASNCSGSVDIIDDGKNGVLFPIGHVEKLYKTMLQLIHDEAKRQTLSSHAKQITELYSENKIYVKWHNIISSI
jgi:GalNAc-alpha-(1->4)-GalNAc-alpha-(1->3)-diNAcBac-PP-undecaprenol alpha-1,4-N-acetyl-D-galactosaminyltransferase